MRTLKNLSFFTLISFFFIACAPKLYTTEDRFLSGTLDASKLDSLKAFLKTNDRTVLKDTIFIKYDFNNDLCWADLNGQNPEFINDSRFAYQNYIKEKATKRPETAVYQYREVGSNFSDIRSAGLEVETDSSAFLKNLLFKERIQCGTSVVILPDGKYLLIKSDSHFEALLLNGNQIKQKIIENLIK